MESKRNVHVLVVEDEFLLSDMICGALRDDGFAVAAARNADEALDHIDSGKQVDVVFTDVNLDDGMDGATLARVVRARRPELPIVYSSGLTTEAGLRPMVSRSMFVPKPYAPREVSALLRRMTDSA
jgi:CheY-like chemotaxis protein